MLAKWGEVWEQMPGGCVRAKKCKIDIKLLLDTNKKLYMGSPTTPLELALSDLKKSKSNVTQIKKAYIW